LILKLKSKIPFEFVLDELAKLEPLVKHMFGCHALYLGTKIIVILRNRPDHALDNGVWIATTPEHHGSLKRDFPSMRSIELFGSPVSAWQNIPADSDDFEPAVLKLCKFIALGDERIGKIPKAKNKKRTIAKELKKT
jgi:hypothetical protein